MDPLAIANGILRVAQSLLGIADRFKAADTARKERLSDLFTNVSDCLAAVSSQIRSGDIPHGSCGQLQMYAELLPNLIRPDVGSATAEELGQSLASSHDVERMAMELSSGDREPALQRIEEASGKFRALAHLIPLS